MPIHMHGRWLVSVHSKEAQFSQRFAITGSSASDGIYDGAEGVSVGLVDGPDWLITFEWNDNDASGWQPSEAKEIYAEFTLASGLIMRIGADDNWPHLRDGDYDDLVLLCENRDPAISGGFPFVNPYDFSLKEGPQTDVIRHVTHRHAAEGKLRKRTTTSSSG